MTELNRSSLYNLVWSLLEKELGDTVKTDALTDQICDAAFAGDGRMKPLPDDLHLEIFWRVAVTSSLEGQGEPYQIFARRLYHYLAGTYDHTTPQTDKQ